MGKESFLIYKSFYKPVSRLSDKQLGRLFRAIFMYQLGEEVVVEEDLEMAFEFFKNQFEIDEDKYRGMVERNRSNGRKGGTRKKATNGNSDDLAESQTAQWNPNNPVGPSGTQTTQWNPNNPVGADNDNENDNENDNNKYSKNDFSKSLKDCLDDLLSNQSWIETVSMNSHSMGYKNLTVEDVRSWINKFFLHLANCGEKDKSPKEAMSHFWNWLKKELEKQKDDGENKNFRGDTSSAGIKSVTF